jgi:glutathione S-transferase
MKLYTNPFSPNGRRALIAAYEVGVQPEIVNVDFSKGEHKNPEYLAKNPNGKVPTLVDDDGFVLWESVAIVQYLAWKHPEKGLVVNDVRQRAEVVRWTAWNASHLEAAVYGVAIEKMIKPMFGGQPDQARIDACTKDWERFAPVLNAQLEGKKWVTGYTFTTADICVGTTVEFATKAGFDLSRYTHIKEWLERVTSREAWKKAG